MKQGDMENEDSKVQTTTYMPLSISWLFSPKIIFGFILMYGGIALPILLKNTNQSLLKQKRLRREQKFTDIDDARASSDKDFQVKVVLWLNELVHLNRIKYF
ncbi:hypothetical protein C9J22_10565 [Photobacterium phosphoreum]|nr:hypothetical protein C9J22_10565 [Photobacterium phosphoreum]PSU76587.1 hypothetical protein CTM67_14485 [Photobacterium phosphoreum]